MPATPSPSAKSESAFAIAIAYQRKGTKRLRKL